MVLTLIESAEAMAWILNLQFFVFSNFYMVCKKLIQPLLGVFCNALDLVD